MPHNEKEPSWNGNDARGTVFERAETGWGQDGHGHGYH